MGIEINDSFWVKNSRANVSEEDYKIVECFVDAAKALTRSTYRCGI